MSRYRQVYDYDDDDDEEETVQKKIYLSDESDLAEDDSDDYSEYDEEANDSELNPESPADNASNSPMPEGKPSTSSAPTKKDRRPSRRDKMAAPKMEEEPVDDVVRGFPTAQQRLKMMALKEKDIPRWVCPVCGLATATREKFEKHILFHDDMFIVLQQYYEEKDQQLVLAQSKKRYTAAGLDLFEKKGAAKKAIKAEPGSEAEKKPGSSEEESKPSEPKSNKSLFDPYFGQLVRWEDSPTQKDHSDEPCSSTDAPKPVPQQKQPQVIHPRPFKQPFPGPIRQHEKTEPKEKPDDGSDSDSDASGDDRPEPPYFIIENGVARKVTAGEAYYRSMKAQTRERTPDLPLAVGRKGFKPEIDPEVLKVLTPDFGRPLGAPHFSKPDKTIKIEQQKYSCTYCPTEAPGYDRIRQMLEHMYFDHWVDIDNLELSTPTYSYKVASADTCKEFHRQCPLRKLPPSEFLMHVLVAHTKQLLGGISTKVALKMSLSVAGDDFGFNVKFEEMPGALIQELHDAKAYVKRFNANDRRHPRIKIAPEKAKEPELVQPPGRLVPMIDQDGRKCAQIMLPNTALPEVALQPTEGGVPEQKPVVQRQVQPQQPQPRPVFVTPQIPTTVTNGPKPSEVMFVDPSGKPVPGIKRVMDPQGRISFQIPKGYKVAPAQQQPRMLIPPPSLPTQATPRSNLPMPLSSTVSRPTTTTMPRQPTVPLSATVPQLTRQPTRMPTPQPSAPAQQQRQPPPQRIPVIRPVQQGPRPNVVSIVRPMPLRAPTMGPGQIRIVQKTMAPGTRPITTITTRPMTTTAPTPVSSAASSSKPATAVSSEEYIDVETVDEAPKPKQQPPKRMMALSNLVPRYPGQQHQQQPQSQPGVTTVRPVRPMRKEGPAAMRVTQPAVMAAPGPRGPRPTATTMITKDANGKIVRVVRTPAMRGSTIVQKPATKAGATTKPVQGLAAKPKARPKPSILQKKAATPIANKALASLKQAATATTLRKKPLAGKPKTAKQTAGAIPANEAAPGPGTMTFITTRGEKRTFVAPSDHEVQELLKSPSKKKARSKSPAKRVIGVKARTTATTTTAKSEEAAAASPAEKKARVVLPAKMPLSAAPPQRTIKRIPAPLIVPITTASPDTPKEASEESAPMDATAAEPIQVDHGDVPESPIDILTVDEPEVTRPNTFDFEPQLQTDGAANQMPSSSAMAYDQQIDTDIVNEFLTPTSSAVELAPQNDGTYVVQSQMPGSNVNDIYADAKYAYAYQVAGVGTSESLTDGNYVVQSQIPVTSADGNYVYQPQMAGEGSFEQQYVDNSNGATVQYNPMYEFGDDADEQLLKDFLEPPPPGSQTSFFSSTPTEQAEQPQQEPEQPLASFDESQTTFVSNVAAEQIEHALPEQEEQAEHLPLQQAPETSSINEHVEEAPTEKAPSAEAEPAPATVADPTDTDDEPIDIMH
uniref:C2H2-type domain-containing protein n=1 Tax=Panagrellus redivivus TaxID=6233 RepID=A0A7E4WDL1_PANRE